MPCCLRHRLRCLAKTDIGRLRDFGSVRHIERDVVRYSKLRGHAKSCIHWTETAGHVRHIKLRDFPETGILTGKSGRVRPSRLEGRVSEKLRKVERFCRVKHRKIERFCSVRHRKIRAWQSLWQKG